MKGIGQTGEKDKSLVENKETSRKVAQGTVSRGGLRKRRSHKEKEKKEEKKKRRSSTAGVTQ